MRITRLIIIITSLCLGSGLVMYYRVYLRPPATPFFEKGSAESSSEYKTLAWHGNAEKLAPFRTRDINGALFDSSDLEGKVVFLNFWTTWCQPCVAEMSAMERLHQKLKDKEFAMVAVNIKESLSQVNGFMRANKLTFTTLLDPDGEIAYNFGVHATPTTFIFGKSGQLLETVVGSRSWDRTPYISRFEQMVKSDPTR